MLYHYLDEKEPYIKLYKFTCSLPMDQAYMLSYLIDVSKHVWLRLKEDPNYFQCSMEGFIKNLLSGWSTYQIKSAIDKLVNRGLIFKRVINIDKQNHTYIALNEPKIIELCEQWELEQLEKKKQKSVVSDKLVIRKTEP